MKRLLILIVCSFSVLTSLAIGQGQEEEPLPPKRSSQAKLGGGGGFTQNWLFLDLDPLNRILSNSGAAEFNKNGMLLLGGQGYGYVLFVQSLRIGGMGAGGTIRSRSLTCVVCVGCRCSPRSSSVGRLPRSARPAA